MLKREIENYEEELIGKNENIEQITVNYYSLETNIVQKEQ